MVLAVALAAVAAGAAFLLLPYLLGAERGEWLAVAQAYGCSIILLNAVVAALRGVDQGELRFLRYNALSLVSAVVYLCGLVTAWALEIISVAAALWVFWSGTCVAALALVLCRLAIS